MMCWLTILLVTSLTTHIVTCDPVTCPVKTYTMCKDNFIPHLVKHFVIQTRLTHLQKNYFQNCYLLMYPQSKPFVLVLHFKKFRLLYDEGCEHDSFKIAGRSFCGHWLTGKTLKLLIEPYKFVEFHLWTSFLLPKRGIHIEAVIVPYSSGEIVLEYSGSGSSFEDDFTFSGFIPQHKVRYSGKLGPTEDKLEDTQDNLFLNVFPNVSTPNVTRAESSTATPTGDPTRDDVTSYKDKDGAVWYKI